MFPACQAGRSAQARPPLRTRRLPMDFSLPRCVVASRSVPDIIAEDHREVVCLDPCCGRGHLRMRETALHFGVPAQNSGLQGRMWGTKSISCVAWARPAAPIKSNPAVTSRLETTPQCIIIPRVSSILSKMRCENDFTMTGTTFV